MMHKLSFAGSVGDKVERAMLCLFIMRWGGKLLDMLYSMGIISSLLSFILLFLI